jgi:hypothetical protein
MCTTCTATCKRNVYRMQNMPIGLKFWAPVFTCAWRDHSQGAQMAMHACSECGNNISTAAESCPHCGLKMRTGRTVSSAIGWAALGFAALSYCSYLVTAPAPSASRIATTPARAACRPGNFAVSKLSGAQEYGYAKLTGIVRNACAYASGVELRWTAFNSDGSVAFSDTFYPASTTNIAPGVDYPFETSNKAPLGRWTYTVTPVSVQQW